MNVHTVRQTIAGPAGVLECAVDDPPAAAHGVAVIAHPHPLYGGTMDNKVVQTLARAFLRLGYRSVRFNFRGIGGSGGAWDEGRGEIDDVLAVATHYRNASQPLALAGFSFGAYAVSQAGRRLSQAGSPAERLLLVGPATSRFEVAPVPPDTIVIHGEHDDVVPLSATLDWARPQALPITVVPGVGHFFHGQLPLLRDLVIRSWHRAAASAPMNEASFEAPESD